jgi:hypothetical protein
MFKILSISTRELATTGKYIKAVLILLFVMVFEYAEFNKSAKAN